MLHLQRRFASNGVLFSSFSCSLRYQKCVGLRLDITISFTYLVSAITYPVRVVGKSLVSVYYQKKKLACMVAAVSCAAARYILDFSRRVYWKTYCSAFDLHVCQFGVSGFCYPVNISLLCREFCVTCMRLSNMQYHAILHPQYISATMTLPPCFVAYVSFRYSLHLC